VSGPRLGFALSSGSARGWAHIGVLQALAERGLKPDVVTGASVGALVAAACAAGRLDDLEHWVRTLTQRDVWRLVDTTFRGGGVMTGNRLMDAISTHIGNVPIESLPVRFGAVATDLYTGEEIWLRDGPFMTAVRASSGVPGLFAPHWHEGRWLIDGGVVNPVPVSLCRALGAEVVIAVDLSRPGTLAALRSRGQEGPATDSAVAATGTEGAAARAAGSDAAGHAPERVEASAEGSAILKKWAGLVDGLVESFRSKRSEPGLVEVMTSAVNIMQDRITRSRLALDPADLLLQPEIGDFQLMDFHRAAEAIAIGREYVEGMTPQVEAFAAKLRGRGPAA
jgi:NTE family protein